MCQGLPEATASSWDALAALQESAWRGSKGVPIPGAVCVFIGDPGGDGVFVIEGDQRGGVSVSDPSSNVVVTNVSLEGAVMAIRGAIGVPVG